MTSSMPIIQNLLFNSKNRFIAENMKYNLIKLLQIAFNVIWI